MAYGKTSAMGNPNAGNSYDYNDNPGYAKYATMTRKDAKDTNSLGKWQEARSFWETSQKHRQQDQDTWWRQEGLRNQEQGIGEARNYQNNAFDTAQNNLTGYGNTMRGLYGEMNERLPGFYDKARGYYDQDVKMGQMGDDFTQQHFGDPNAYRRQLVGELDPNAIMGRADEAYQDSLRSSNSVQRSGLNTLAYGGAEEARHNTALRDEEMAYGRHQNDMSQARHFGDRGMVGRTNQANLTQGEWDAFQRLKNSQIGDEGQLATFQNNLTMGQGEMNAGLSGALGQARANTSYAQGKMGREDLTDWLSNQRTNDSWLKNALYSDNVRQETMDFQREMAKNESRNALMSSAFGLAGSAMGTKGLFG